MSAVELLWLSHEETTSNLMENKKGQVRRYLTDTKDYEVLRQWDTQKLADN